MRGTSAKYRRYGLPLGWPTAVILCVTASLWMMWPKGRYAPHSSRRLPEPGAAYVVVESGAGPLYQRPMLFALPSRIGFGARSYGPLPDQLPGSPEVFVPRFLPIDRLDQPGPDLVRGPRTVNPAGMPDYGWRFTDDSASPDERANETAGLRVVYSPGLKRTGFRVPPPSATDSDVFWRLTFYLEPASGSDLGTRIFVEKEGTPPRESSRAWLSAVRRAAFTHAAARGILRVETVVRKLSEVDKQGLPEP